MYIFELFTHTDKGCIIGTGTAMWLTRNKWGNPEWCGALPSHNSAQQILTPGTPVTNITYFNPSMDK